jgi:outer membrane lipoprotein carrier protein
MKRPLTFFGFRRASCALPTAILAGQTSSKEDKWSFYFHMILSDYAVWGGGFLLIVTAHIFSSSPSVAAPLPKLMQKVQVEYQKAAGIEAQFDQMTDVKATKQKKKAQGRIWIKRPNKLRWETINPDPNILISDGKTFWFYTPPFEKGERGQVLIKKSAQVQTQFLNALLSGSFDFGKSETSIEIKGANTFLLKPKKGTAGDVDTAEVTINSETHKIEKVVLDHLSGNRTEIKLQEIKLPTQIDEKYFRYTPDHNTDTIRE